MHGVTVVVATTLLALVTFAGSRGLAKLSRDREQLVRGVAGGVSVAFVMLDLFVELAESSAGELHGIMRAGPKPVHTVAALLLVGTLAAFVATSWMAKREDVRSSWVVALAPHAVYLMLVGAALVEEAHEGYVPLLLIWIAMAVHLSVLEHGLAERHPNHAGVRGAVVLATGLFAGMGLWMLATPDAAVFSVLLALVAGATLLIAFRDELPTAREAHVGGVLVGAALFTLLQQLRWWL